jgi:hypothetical protein
MTDNLLERCRNKFYMRHGKDRYNQIIPSLFQEGLCTIQKLNWELNFERLSSLDMLNNRVR